MTVLPTTISAFAEEAETFLRSVAVPHSDSGTDRRSAPQVRLFPERETSEELDQARYWLRTRFDGGFGFLTGPADLGGRGLGIDHEVLYTDLERQYEVPDLSGFGVSRGVIAPTLLDWGSAEQQQIVPRLHRGDLVACQLFSEPAAGSDLASVATTASATDGGWSITGSKVWTSGAHHSDLGLALCHTKSGTGAKHADLTMFLIDMTQPGVEVRPLRQMTGGASFNEIFLDSVSVGEDAIVGSIGNGWRVARTTLDHERRGGSAGPAGQAMAVASVLLTLARDQQLQGSARQAVIEAYTQQRILGWLTARSIGADGALAPLLKLSLTETLRQWADTLGSMVGPSLIAPSTPEATMWSEFVLGVPGYRIAGGTDEIQRNVIGERLLGLPR